MSPFIEASATPIIAGDVVLPSPQWGAASAGLFLTVMSIFLKMMARLLYPEMFYEVLNACIALSGVGFLLIAYAVIMQQIFFKQRVRAWETLTQEQREDFLRLRPLHRKGEDLHA